MTRKFILPGLLLALNAAGQGSVEPGTTLVIDAGTDLRIEGTGLWTLPTGSTVVNNGQLTLGPAMDVQEAPGAAMQGLGLERTVRTLGAVAGLDIAGLGAGLTSAVPLGTTTVVRGHVPFTDQSGSTSIARWMRIQPSTNAGLNATLAFRYDAAELNGVPETDQVLHIRHGADEWMPLPGAVNVADRRVIASGLDSMGTFTTFSGELPNALADIPSTAAMRLAMDGDGGGWLHVPAGATVRSLELFDLRGARIAEARVNWVAGWFQVPVAAPGPGAYLLRVNGRETFKWMRP